WAGHCARFGRPPRDREYELCGPGIEGNPSNSLHLEFMKLDMGVASPTASHDGFPNPNLPSVEVAFQRLRAHLHWAGAAEGLVFRRVVTTSKRRHDADALLPRESHLPFHASGDRCQIRRVDFGLPWPIADEEEQARATRSLQPEVDAVYEE